MRSFGSLVLLVVSVPVVGWAEITRDMLVPVKAENGAPVIGKVKPTWCDDIEVGDGTSESAVRALGRSTSNQYLDGNGQLRVPTTSPCVAPDDPLMQEQLGAYLQRWANLTGQNVTDLTEFMAARAKEDEWNKLKEEACKPYGELSEEASHREKTLTKMSGWVLDCNTDIVQEHPMWEMDRYAAPPSQIAETYFVLKCLGESDPKEGGWSLYHSATCRADAAQLDREKLEAELKAANANDYVKIVARQQLQTAKFRASIWEKALQAKVAKDEDLKALLIDVPEKAWKAWQAEYDANKAVFEEVYAYEDKYNGSRRSAAKGCLKPAYAALRKYTATIKGNGRDEIIAALTTNTGAALLEYVWSCNDLEGRELAANALSQLIEAGMPRRGPRFAASVAMGEALAKIMADRPKFPVDGQAIGADYRASYPVGRSYSEFTQAKGSVVAKVTTKGDKATVAFKTESWVEDEMECKETNRIAMFERDGTPIYHRNCRYTGRKVTQSSTSEPFYAWPEVVEGIGPGSFVRYRTGSKYVDRVFDGYPVEVFADKSQKKLINILGVKVR